jgi:uncharacterized protein YbjT (DUF2867 family)
MTILLTGATGTNGQEIARQLAAASVPFRALSRTQKGMISIGGEIISGDMNDVASLDCALKGVSRVLILSAVSPDQVLLQGNVVAAARRANVERIVKFSALGADPVTSTTLNRWHGVTEKAIEDSGIAWTHLRPNSLFQNIRRFKKSIERSGLIANSVGDARVSMVDLRDVAAVAVAALTSVEFRNEALEITGPEAISYTDFTAAAARAFGRPITYRPISDEEVRQSLIAAGSPKWAAEVTCELNVAQRAGRYAKVTDTVYRTTGRPPRRVDEALRALAQTFSTAETDQPSR